MNLSSVNHIRSATLPPSTPTNLWNKPVPILKGVSYVAAAIAAVGILDTGRTIINREESSFSFWDILRPISWLSTVLLAHFFTKPPIVSFERDLVSNSVKDIVDNVTEIIEGKNLQALNNKSIKGLASIVNEMMERAYHKISEHFEEKKQEGNYYSGESFIDEYLKTKAPLLAELYEKVFYEKFDEKISEKDRANKFKKFLKDKDLLYRLGSQGPGLEIKIKDEILHSFFASGNHESKNKETTDTKIKNEINNIIEPIGLTLSNIEYDESNNGIKLFFVNTKGYPNENNSKDGPFHVLGSVIHIDSVEFLYLILNIAESSSGLSKNRNIKEALAKTLGPILGLIPYIHTTDLVYDPKTSGDYVSSKNLGSIINMLNDSALNKINKLFLEIMGQNYGVSKFARSIGGADSEIDSRDDGKDKVTSSVDKDKSRKTSSGSGDNADSVLPSIETEENDLNKLINNHSSKSEVFSILKKRYPYCGGVLEQINMLDFRSSPSESVETKKLKYCLLKIATQNNAIRLFKGNDVINHVKLVLGNFSAEFPYLKEFDRNNATIVKSDEDRFRYKIPEELLDLKYFFAVTKTSFDDPSRLKKIANLLYLVDRKQVQKMRTKHESELGQNDITTFEEIGPLDEEIRKKVGLAK